MAKSKTKSKKEESSIDTSTASGKQAAIQSALAQITKEFGDGSIMRMGDDDSIKDVETIPTGAVSLDVALGVGGIPKGRIVEIYGPESSGKTSLTLHIAAEAQKQGGVVAFIDAEHAFDPSYARKIGINTDDLLISQPDYGEQALEILETLTRSGAVDLIIVDSVAALTPKAEIEGDMGDSHMGLQARLMSQALRKITGIVGKTGTTVIFINQLRMKIGVMFGNPETTTGGNALKFYSSIRMDIRRVERIGTKEDVKGHVVRVKVVKNKVAPPFKEAYFDMINGIGIDKDSSLIDVAVKLGVIEKAGSWYKYNGENLGQGKDGVKDILTGDDNFRQELLSKVYEVSGINNVEVNQEDSEKE